MTTERRLFACALATAMLLACEKPSRENIEKWRHTVKGPEKLRDALVDPGITLDLRAMAAQSLVAIDHLDEVKAVLGAMKEADREAVVGALLPLLWGDSRPANALTAPTPAQITAKDALFTMRALASAQQRSTIDGYLADWYGAFYEGRAGLGSNHGEQVVRVLGGRIAPKLVADARQTLAHPDAGNGKVLVVTTPLLRGIGFTGTPEGVEFLLDLVEKKGLDAKYPDETLGDRAMQALGDAYLDEHEAVDGAALIPSLARLRRLALSESLPGETVNVAFMLLAASGKGSCLPPLVELAQSRDIVRMWEAVGYGIKCAGVDAIVPLAEALPQDRDYEFGIIEKYFWAQALALGPGAAAPARTLLDSKSWVARLTGVEMLDKLGTAADVPRVRALAKDTTKLRGWFGKKKDKKDKKEPSLGSEATAVADRLEQKH